MWGKYFRKDFASFPRGRKLVFYDVVDKARQKERKYSILNIYVHTVGARLLMTHGSLHIRNIFTSRSLHDLFIFNLRNNLLLESRAKGPRMERISEIFFRRRITVITALLLLFPFSLSHFLYKQIRIRGAIKYHQICRSSAHIPRARHYTKTMRTTKKSL